LTPPVLPDHAACVSELERHRPGSPSAAAKGLENLEEHFRLILENVRDYAIFMLDPHGRIATWSAGAEQIKGYRASDILGRHFSIFYTAEDVAAGKPDRELELARQHGRVEDEGWRVRKNGELFWANVVVTAIWSREGVLQGFAKITRDLTERRARQDAERRAALAQETNRLKDDFLAIVSHELRTPLNVALGQVAMLRSGRLDQEQADRAWVSLQRNLALQARIIEDLLDISRVVTGRLTLDSRPVDFGAIVREIVDETTAAAAARDVTIVLEIVSADPAYTSLMGDPARLRQIVSNLLSNAAKFTPAGGQIDVVLHAAADEILFRVTDTGIGISPEFLPHVFERFSQADSTPRREAGGLGLGLAITREIVTLKGGTITVDSAGIGRGATFEVRLPRRA
jgi:PAS domain S-box-containing protein